MENGMSIRKAAIINGIGKYAVVFFSFLFSAILARILSPEDYGVVAVVVVFSTFFSMLSNMGLGVAIVQHKELDESDVDNIYSFSVYVSFGLFFLFLFVSYPISVFYKDIKYFYLCILLSVALLFDSLSMVPNGILNRDKRFALISLRTIAVYILSSIITVLCALFGLKYYSIVIGSIVSAVALFIWNKKSCGLSFRMKFSMTSIKKVFGYSFYQFSFNFINYFARNLDNLLTGKFIGAESLGFYNKAYTLMLYPINNLAGVVSPVLHPILSEYKDDKKIIYNKSLDIIKLLGYIGLNVSVVCYLCSYEIITAIYGNQWGKSVICFKFLSIAILPQMVNSCAGSVFQSIGNTRLLFQNACINVAITVLAVFYGIFVGGNIETLALCVAISYILHFFISYGMLLKCGFEMKISCFCKDMRSFFAITVIMWIVALCYRIEMDSFLWGLIIKIVYVLVFNCILLGVSGQYKVLGLLLKK